MHNYANDDAHDTEGHNMIKELTQKQKDELAYQQAMQEFLANGGVIQQIPRNK